MGNEELKTDLLLLGFTQHLHPKYNSIRYGLRNISIWCNSTGTWFIPNKKTKVAKATIEETHKFIMEALDAGK